MSGWLPYLRRTLTGLALSWWILFGWLITHRSRSPVHLGRYSNEYLTFLIGVAVLGLVLAAAAYLAHRPPQRLRSLRLATSLGLLLASSVITLLVTEGLIRGFDLLGASFYQEITFYMMDLVADENLVYRHRPGFRAVYQGVDFSTNELGLRERPIGARLPDTSRILILGDSVTLGWGVPVENTFSRRLEGELGTRTGGRFRTINAGVSGYNTDQELGFFQHHADRLDPDLVVLVYVDNDIGGQLENIEELREYWNSPPGSNAFLLRWSWLYRTIYHIGPYLISGGSTVDESDPGWQASMRSLAGLQGQTRQRGIPLVVFLFRITANPTTDALDRELSRMAGREGFPYADMLPWFEGVNIRTVVNSFLDVHPNSAGHAIMARGMADFLVERDLVPGGRGHP